MPTQRRCSYRQSRQTAYAVAQERGHGLWPVAIYNHTALVCRFNSLHPRNPWLLLIYQLRKDGRLSWRSWLTHSAQFTQKWSPVNHRSGTGQENSPAIDRRPNHWDTPPTTVNEQLGVFVLRFTVTTEAWTEIEMCSLHHTKRDALKWTEDVCGHPPQLQLHSQTWLAQRYQPLRCAARYAIRDRFSRSRLVLRDVRVVEPTPPCWRYT